MITAPVFTTDKKAEEITLEDVAKYVRIFRDDEFLRREKLARYYEGRHAILDRVKSSELANQKIVTNHAKYISDFASAYLLGEPVSYTADSDITEITDALRIADSATQDADLALDCSIFGVAYDLTYMAENDTKIKLARISPLNAFVVYDDTVEQNPVFGVYFYPVYKQNTFSADIEKYKCQLLTDKYIQSFELSPTFMLGNSEEPTEHFFGKVPLDEIYNNGQRMGDFEQVTTLIDAYNMLQSDRVNDKEQFVDAILVIKGMVLGDTNAEKRETLDAVRENRALELASDADVSYLTRQLDEASVEVLRKDIVADIHKISGVPDMSDEHFAGNSSGVAMKYKLLALEQLTKTKERYFAEGLRYRLEMIANIKSIQGKAFDVSEIRISFKRSLPANELEEAQVAATLNGVVPQSVILSNLSFVDDVEAAMDELAAEKQQAISEQQQMFMNTPIKPQTEYEQDDEA